MDGTEPQHGWQRHRYRSTERGEKPMDPALRLATERYDGAAWHRGSMFQDHLLTLNQAPPGATKSTVSHWSIAWSDLMMTMFILFLSLFVYQAAHQEFLAPHEPEIVGGVISDALAIAADTSGSFPFVPIRPTKPIVDQASTNRVASITRTIIADAPRAVNDQNRGLQLLPAPDSRHEKGTGNSVDTTAWQQPAAQNSGRSQSETQANQTEAPAILAQRDEVNTIFSLSKAEITALASEGLAAVDLVPDKTLRIILTSDLLFKTGVASLSRSALKSLQNIAALIQNTPYIVNVIGHTDNTPMSSAQFPTNWELSVARASTVARFLIEEMGLDPHQLTVSGYSSYRPIKPNTNARNKAMNRRVEITISKQLPAPLSAASDHLEYRPF